VLVLGINVGASTLRRDLKEGFFVNETDPGEADGIGFDLEKNSLAETLSPFGCPNSSGTGSLASQTQPALLERPLRFG